MVYDKVYCLKTICLYLKDYLSDEQFEKLFSEHISVFQVHVEEDLYLDIIFANVRLKEERITLKTKLYQYILRNDSTMYQNTNDMTVERMIMIDPEDELVQILKKKYEKQSELYIACSGINTAAELIHKIKQSLQFPIFCGENWDAVADLLCDVVFPEKLIFADWGALERRLPQDAGVLKQMLEQYASDRCVIIYE